MKAKYCPCKNTYTINNCKCEKKGRMYYSALPHGIGSLVGQGNSNITRQVVKSNFNIRVEADGGQVFESTCLNHYLSRYGIGRSQVDE